MRTKTVILAFIISLGLVLTMTATSLATIIEFSGSTSDGTDPIYLGAMLDFSLNDAKDVLTINIFNCTYTSDYVISTLYFNISSDVFRDRDHKMVLYDYDKGQFPKPYLKMEKPPGTTALGPYDVILDFAKDSDAGIESGFLATFQISVQGNDLGEDDFFVPSSLGPSAQLYFTQVSGDDSVLVAATPLSTAAVPEPATLLLFGTGLVGLVGLGRKKGFIKE